jgi:hypothetical protein
MGYNIDKEGKIHLDGSPPSPPVTQSQPPPVVRNPPPRSNDYFSTAVINILRVPFCLIKTIILALAKIPAKILKEIFYHGVVVTWIFAIVSFGAFFWYGALFIGIINSVSFLVIFFNDSDKVALRVVFLIGGIIWSLIFIGIGFNRELAWLTISGISNIVACALAMFFNKDA